MNATATSQPLSPTAQTHRRPWVRWFIRGLAALLLIAVALFGLIIWRMSYVPADLDTAITRPSAQGFFRGTYTPKLDPLRINQIHTWTFHLENKDRQPLEGAQISVDGGMPQHGHGLPTLPQVTKALGNGDYQVEGMKFHMPGWWVVNFHITAQGQSDTITFNLILK